MKKLSLMTIILPFTVSFTAQAADKSDIITKIVAKSASAKTENLILLKPLVQMPVVANPKTPIFLTTTKSMGGVNGGGGNSVICTDPNGAKSVALLDFVEAKTLRRNHIAIYDKKYSYTDILKDRFMAVQKISPTFEKTLVSEFSKFQNEALFLKDAELNIVNDSNHVSVPHGCVVVQTVIQKEKRSPGDKKFFINENVWNLLPEFDKAGLVLHEIIYSLLRAETYAPETSESTRFLNSWIFSDEFKGIDKLRFAAFLFSAGFNYITIDQTTFDTRSFAATGWLFKLSGEQPVVLSNIATTGNINFSPENGVLRAVSGNAALKLGEDRLFVQYAQFSENDELYALAVVEEFKTTAKSCWIKITKNNLIAHISPSEIPNIPRLQPITDNPKYPTQGCVVETKTTKYEEIKMKLFSAL